MSHITCLFLFQFTGGHRKSKKDPHLSCGLCRKAAEIPWGAPRRASRVKTYVWIAGTLFWRRVAKAVAHTEKELVRHASFCTIRGWRWTAHGALRYMMSCLVTCVPCTLFTDAGMYYRFIYVSYNLFMLQLTGDESRSGICLFHHALSCLATWILRDTTSLKGHDVMSCLATHSSRGHYVLYHSPFARTNTYRHSRITHCLL